MIQATVGSDQLGKVMTCFYTLVSVTLPLGSLAFSFLADRFVETFDYYYGDSKIVSYHNVIFCLTVARQNYCL